MYYDAGLGLLQHDTSTGVLNSFPLNVRRDICKSVVTQLATPGSGKHLTSTNHMNWMMEVLGQTLRLPMEDSELMYQAINIYKVWLEGVLTPNQTSRAATPKPVLADPEFYFATIYKHFTLVFEPRLGEPIKRQVELCQRIILIMQRNGRHSNEVFTFNLWEILLKCLLGVCHALLAPKAHEGDLAECLVKPLLRVLIESWLHACGCCFPNPTMWANLRKLCGQWRHRIELVHQWNATCLCLTRRVLNLLYGPSEGTPSILVTGGGGDGAQVKSLGNVKINIPDDCVVQAWHRMLHIIGNPSHIRNAQIFLLAIEGISNVVDCFLAVGNDEVRAGKYSSEKLVEELAQRGHPTATPTPNRPSGNSLLHIFGEWLFESSYSKHIEGRSRALGLLCRIFSSKQLNDKFLPVYLARFYTAVTDGLNMDILALTEIVMSSTMLFLLELEGSRVLVIPFVLALEKILAQQIKLYAPHPVEALRRASISVLVAVFSMPNNFQRLDIKTCSRAHLEREAKKHNANQGVNVSAQVTTRPSSTTLSTSPTSHTIGDMKRQTSYNERDNISHADAIELSSKGERMETSVSSNVQDISNKTNISTSEFGKQSVVRPNGVTNNVHSRSNTHGEGGAEADDVTASIESVLSPTASTGNAVTPKAVRSTSEVCNTSRPEQDPSNIVAPQSTMHSGMSAPARTSSLKGLSGAHVKTLLHLKSRIKHLLVKAFESETDPINTQMLLYALTSYVCEEAEHTPSIAQQILRSILRRLIRLDWRSDVTHTAFETLTWMIHVRDLLESRSLDIIMCLCKYIMDQASQPPTRHNVELHSKIAGAYRCLQAWITADPQIVTDRQTLNNILEVIELGLTGTCRATSISTISRTDKLTAPKPLSQRAKLAAELLLASLVNHVGHLPSINGPTSVSSLVTEKSLLRDLASLQPYISEKPATFDVLSQYMRYFVLDDDRIVCFCDIPAKINKTESTEDKTSGTDNSPTVWVIVRDVSGRFCFQTSLRYVSDVDTSVAGLNEDSSVTGMNMGTGMSNDSKKSNVVSPINSEFYSRDEAINVDTRNKLSESHSSPQLEYLHSSRNALRQEEATPVVKTKDPGEDTSTNASDILYFHETAKHPQLPSVDDYVAVKSSHKATELVRNAIERENTVRARFEVSTAFAHRLHMTASVSKDLKLSNHTAAIIVTTPAHEPIPMDKYVGDSKFQMGRLLGSHAGLFGLPNVRRLSSKKGRRRIIPLTVSSQLLKDLYDFDDIPMRDTEQIHVLHMPSKCTAPIDLVKYRDLSSHVDFIEFLLAMCWVVSLDTHRGWKGPNPSPNGFPRLLYYSDMLSELVVDCPALLRDTPITTHSGVVDQLLASPIKYTVKNTTQRTSRRHSRTDIPSENMADFYSANHSPQDQNNSVSRSVSAPFADIPHLSRAVSGNVPAFTRSDSLTVDQESTHVQTSTRSVGTLTSQPTHEERNMGNYKRTSLLKLNTTSLTESSVPKSDGRIATHVPTISGTVEGRGDMSRKYMSFDKLTSNDMEQLRLRLETDASDVECVCDSPSGTTSPALSRTGSGMTDDRSESVTHESILRKCDEAAGSFVVVVWVENFDDHVFFPFKDKEKLRIYVHPLQSGLFRIKVESAFLEGPLFDGMTVSRLVLGPLVRQTALNALRRRRINGEKSSSRGGRDEDVATRPHHIRKSKMEEIVKNHSSDNSLPEFYEQLLKPLQF
eukprot:CFRG5961T1